MDANQGIRNAALLVASLDAATADRLLEGLPEHQARRIREAAVMLDRVDDTQQRQLLDELRRGAMAKAAPTAPPPNVPIGVANDGPEDRPKKRTIVPDPEPAGIELDGRLAELCGGGDPAEHLKPWQPPRADEPDARSRSARPGNDLPPLAFLHAAEGNTLAEALRDERPLTIAVVVAHLPPGRAGGLLERLEPEQRQQVVRCLAHLEETDAEVLREIDAALQSRLVAHVTTHPRRAVGTDAIAGILNECSPEMRQQILGDLGDCQMDLGATGTVPGANAGLPSSASAVPSATGVAPVPEGVSPMPEGVSPVPEIDFDELGSLAERDLGRLVAETHPQLLHLAMLGAPARMVARVCRALPEPEGQRLARRLRQPGPVRLGDIDKARTHMTRLAARLDQQGTIRLPSPTSMPLQHA